VAYKIYLTVYGLSAFAFMKMSFSAKRIVFFSTVSTVSEIEKN